MLLSLLLVICTEALSVLVCDAPKPALAVEPRAPTLAVTLLPALKELVVEVVVPVLLPLEYVTEEALAPPLEPGGA